MDLAEYLSIDFHPVGDRGRSSLLRDLSLDRPMLEFVGVVTMASRMFHVTEAM